MTSSDFTKIGSLWNNHKIQFSSWDLELNYTLLASTQPNKRLHDTIVLWYSSQNAIDADYIIDYHLGRPELPTFDGFIIAVDSNSLTHITEIKIHDTFQNRSKSCQIIESSDSNRNESLLLAVRYADGTLMVNHTSRDSSPKFCVVIQDLIISPQYFFGVTASTRITERSFAVNSFKFYQVGVEYKGIPATIPDEVVKDDVVVVERADMTLIAYVYMINITVLVVLLIVVAAIFIWKFTNARETPPQPATELVRLASLREEESKRNSDNIYERTPSGSYHVYQRTPSGNYHIYQKPKDLRKMTNEDDYDHLNFCR